MNVMTVDGYSAKIGCDPVIDMFGGEILGLAGGADFYGNTRRQAYQHAGPRGPSSPHGHLIA